MKVINLSLDNKILDKNSAVAQRAISYGALLDEYLIVLVGKNQNVNLSAKTKVVAMAATNKFFTLFKIYKYLLAKLSVNKYDIITIQDTYYLAFLGLFLGKKFHIKVELQVHGFEKLSGLRKFLAKYNLKRADTIRVVSQRLKDKIVSEFSVEAKKLYIVPVAIDKDHLIALQDGFNLKEQYPNNFIFLTVSRLVPIKNIAMQIRALSQIKNDNIKLVIVGEGPEENNLKNLVSQLGLSDKVEFSGAWVEHLASYYQSADCLLLSSNSEGYGMVVAEAVLAGLPVIMTEVGVAGELLENNVNGLVVPVADEQSFTQAMMRVIEEDSLLQKFSANSIAFKDKILDKEQLINKVVEHWQTIL
ncbi:MAG: glycosyltransferase [Patescibacteria group bacterium]